MKLFHNRKQSQKDIIENITLEDIYVGQADGLAEAQETEFENFFYKGNNKYQELAADRRKFIISGKKGTGKTVLAKYFEMEQNKQGKYSKILTERDAKLKQFMEFGKLMEEPADMEFFTEYSIYCEFANEILRHCFMIILRHPLHMLKSVRAFRYLKKVVRDRIGVDNYYKESVSRQNTRTQEYETTASKKFDEDVIDGKILYTESTSIEEHYKKNPYYNILDELKRNVDMVLKYQPINLIYDDLDEYDEIITGNRNFVKFFNYFLKIANRLNHDKHKGRLIIIIRSDMLNPLNNASKNLAKIIADSQVKLNWLKKVGKNEMHPLIEMIVMKIRISNKHLKNLSSEEIYVRFFPAKIDGIDSVNYMLNSSFGRPRDIINMLNVIKEDNPKKNRFTKSLFTATRYDYSEKFLIELRNELSSHYTTERIDECFNLISQIGKQAFWLNDIKQIFEKKETEIKTFATPEEFYEMCYEFGILGNVWFIERPNGSTKKYYSWKFREDGKPKPNPEKKFCIHNALVKVLLE